jgi:hypothetical protein
MASDDSRERDVGVSDGKPGKNTSIMAQAAIGASK